MSDEKNPTRVMLPSLIQPANGQAKMRRPGAMVSDSAAGEDDAERLLCHPGVICVVGRTSEADPDLLRVAARVYYKTAPTDLKLPPAGEYTEGTAFATAKPWPPNPQQLYNFRFVNCAGGEDQEVAGGEGTSTENWLVIWGQFDGTNDMVVIHGPEKIKLIAANETSCGVVNCG